jgi:hypothetical protein
MIQSIIVGLDALRLLAPSGAVRWRPLIGPPPTLCDVVRASVYVDARALSWHHGFEAGSLGYLKLSSRKGARSSSVVYAFGCTRLHAFQPGWHLAPSAGTEAVSSHVLQLGPKVPIRWGQASESADGILAEYSCALVLQPKYFVLGNGMVLRHGASFHPVHGREREF